MSSQSSYSHALVPRDESALVRLRREDIAALADGSRRHARAGRWIGAAPPVGGLVTFVGMLALQELGGLALLSTPICVGTSLVAAVGVAWRAWRAERRRRAEFAFSCPACGHDIVSARPFVDDSAVTALVIATGTCPACGTHILAD